MKFLLVFLSIFVYSATVLAEADIDKLCKPLSRKMGWHKGDTIRWKNKVLPAFKQNIEDSKDYAIENSTFKESLYAIGYDVDKVNDNNSLRLQKECDITNLNSSSTCHHFKTHCLSSITTDSMNTALDNFNWCASNRHPSCGESFQTIEGINANMNELTSVNDEIQKQIDKAYDDPNLSQYYDDVKSSFEELEAKLEKSKKAAEQAKKDLEQEIEEEFAKKKKLDANFKNCCDILEQCNEYLKNKNYTDKHSLLSQISYCHREAAEAEPAVDELSDLLNGLDSFKQKTNLKNLAINSLESSTKQTVKEYASVYNALHGRKPSSAQMCKDLPQFCNSKTAKLELQKADFSNIPKRDFLQDIKTFNQNAKRLNALCKQTVGKQISPELEGQISDALAQTMYHTDIGRLMGVQEFRDKIPPFNQKNCYKKGEGFELISEDSSGVSFVKDATQDILSLQKDKSKKIIEQKKSVQYASDWTSANDKDYLNVLKEIIRNDPYMVREALQSSGNPEEALWICKATHKIYQGERAEAWAQGAAIVGSLLFAIFTFGAGTPALVAVLAATSIGIYNLDKSMTARHNAEMAAAIKSKERILNSMELQALDGAVEAAYVEIGMSILPGLSIAGKAIGPTLKASSLLKTLPAAGKLSSHSSKLLNAIKAGREVTQEMIQKALASKLPNANPAKLQQFSSFLIGTADNMALQMIAFVSAYPDPPGPFSEEGMKSLAISLASSVGFSGLSLKAKAWVNRVKQQRLIAQTRNNPNLNKRDLAVYQDATSTNQKAVLESFEAEVALTPEVAGLMNKAHLAKPGFEKNKQIKLLIDEVASQPNMTPAKAKDLVLGKEVNGVRTGGLASSDVMILGTQKAPTVLQKNDYDFIASTPNISDKYSNYVKAVINGDQKRISSTYDDLYMGLAETNNPSRAQRVLDQAETLSYYSKAELKQIKTNYSRARQELDFVNRSSSFEYINLKSRDAGKAIVGDIDLNNFNNKKFNIEAQKVYTGKRAHVAHRQEAISMNADELKSYLKFIKNNYDFRSQALTNNSFNLNGQSYKVVTNPQNQIGSPIKEVAGGSHFGGGTELGQNIGSGWREFDLPIQRQIGDRGQTRILYNGKKFLITNDHYNTFYNVKVD